MIPYILGRPVRDIRFLFQSCGGYSFRFCSWPPICVAVSFRPLVASRSLFPTLSSKNGFFIVFEDAFLLVLGSDVLFSSIPKVDANLLPLLPRKRREFSAFSVAPRMTLTQTKIMPSIWIRHNSDQQPHKHEDQLTTCTLSNIPLFPEISQARTNPSWKLVFRRSFRLQSRP